MATKAKQPTVPKERSTGERHVALEMERGTVAVTRDGLTFSVSGKNVQLRKQSPLHLSFDSGKVEYDDGEIRVTAEGDEITLKMD